MEESSLKAKILFTTSFVKFFGQRSLETGNSWFSFPGFGASEGQGTLGTGVVSIFFVSFRFALLLP